MGTWRDGGEIGGGDLPPRFAELLGRLNGFQCDAVARVVFPLLNDRYRKIEAIKRLRQASEAAGGDEWCLRDAKDFVDLLYQDFERGWDASGMRLAIEDRIPMEASGEPEAYARRRRSCMANPGLSPRFRSLLESLTTRTTANIVGVFLDFIEGMGAAGRDFDYVRRVQGLRDVSGLGLKDAKDLLDTLVGDGDSRRRGFLPDDDRPVCRDDYRGALVSRACDWALPVLEGNHGVAPDVVSVNLAMRVLSIAEDMDLASLDGRPVDPGEHRAESDVLACPDEHCDLERFSNWIDMIPAAHCACYVYTIQDVYKSLGSPRLAPGDDTSSCREAMERELVKSSGFLTPRGVATLVRCVTEVPGCYVALLRRAQGWASDEREVSRSVLPPAYDAGKVVDLVLGHLDPPVPAGGLPLPAGGLPPEPVAGHEASGEATAWEDDGVDMWILVRASKKTDDIQVWTRTFRREDDAKARCADMRSSPGDWTEWQVHKVWIPWEEGL